MKSPEKPIVTQALLYWSGAGSRTRVYYGANAVQPAFGNASPNHCIQMGSSPAQNIMTGYPGGISLLLSLIPTLDITFHPIFVPINRKNANVSFASFDNKIYRKNNS